VIPKGKANVKPVVRRRPQHPDAELLWAASEVFAREGFAGASVARIAKQAGATKPTLYARFGSKADLYEATVRDHAQAIREHLFAAYDRAAQLEMAEAIQVGVDAWFAFAQERPDGMRLLFGEDAGAASPVAAETTAAIIDRIATVTGHFAERGGRSAGSAASLVAAMIVGTCVYAIRRCLDDPGLDPDAVSALTTSFLVAAAAGFDPRLYARFEHGPGGADGYCGSSV
jgi:AcrR family transcriptional regulator